MGLDLNTNEDQAGGPDGAMNVSRRTLVGGFAALVASLPTAEAALAATNEKVVPQYRPVSTGTDYATTDSAYYDPNYPPMHFPHSFMNKGKPIQSFMWLASGAEAKGCVILSPQRYGGDSLDSLVPALLGAGIHVMRFNPRGMWDDKEEYSFPGALDDLFAAVDFLRENGGQHIVPPGAGFPRPFRVDVNKIAVLGKSGGGGMIGWIGAAESAYINAAISVSPAELLVTPLPQGYAKEFADLKVTTAGRVDLVTEMAKLTPAIYERFNMRRAATRLVNKNTLLIGHSNREHLQTIHQPIVDAMQKAGARRFSQAILEGDGYYLTARIALTRLVISWLKNECGY